MMYVLLVFFFSSRRRHTRLVSDWSSDVCSSDLARGHGDTAGRSGFSCDVRGRGMGEAGIPHSLSNTGIWRDGPDAKDGRAVRSEERRVGKEGRERGGREEEEKRKGGWGEDGRSG